MRKSPGKRSSSKRLSQRARKFIESVLALRPRIAVFDCDGTLWEGDGGKDFLYWEISNKVIPVEVAAWAAPRYESYERGEVSELQMCGEMVTLHAGLSVSALQAASRRYFEEVLEPRIFPEMQELTQRLVDSGCELWAVSSTNDWVIQAGVRHFAIPTEHVLAASVECANGKATDRLIRVPTDEGKVEVIVAFIGQKVDVIFGNSIHDAAMLALPPHPFAIAPNPDLESLARQNGWPIYWPDFFDERR